MTKVELVPLQITALGVGIRKAANSAGVCAI